LQQEEANDGDASVRIGKTNKGTSIEANTFQVSGILSAKRNVLTLTLLTWRIG
jgi:hypothetical protein